MNGWGRGQCALSPFLGQVPAVLSLQEHHSVSHPVSQICLVAEQLMENVMEEEDLTDRKFRNVLQRLAN